METQVAQRNPALEGTNAEPHRVVVAVAAVSLLAAPLILLKSAALRER